MKQTDKIFILLFLLLLLVSIYSHFNVELAIDRDWLLRVANMWLHGSRIGVDIVEVNPPFIIWIDAIAVLLGTYTHISAFYALICMGMCAVGTSAILALKIFKAHPDFSADTRLCVALTAAIIFILLIFESPFFAFDRDHLFFILVFPYLMRWTPALQEDKLSRPLRILIAIMAGASFFFKPYSLVIFASVQIMVLARTRSLKSLLCIENAIILFMYTAYITVIAITAPEYFRTVMPMAIISYPSITRPADRIENIVLSLLFLGMLWFARPLNARSFNAEIKYCLGLTTGFACYAFANNGWVYTFYPLWGIILFTMALLVVSLLTSKEKPSPQSLQSIRICAAAFAICSISAICHFSFLNETRCSITKNCPLENAMETVFIKEHTHSYAVFSSVFAKTLNVAKYYDQEWSIRFNALWMLPRFFLEDEAFRAKNEWVPAYVAQALADDLNNRKPAIIFVDDSPEWPYVYRSIDILSFLKQYPAFATAWQLYKPLEVIDVCRNKETMICRYKVFKRVQ